MRTIRNLTCIMVGATIFTLASCSKRPEQLNVVLRLNKEHPESVSEIVESVANRTGMSINSYKSDVVDGRGQLTAYLIYDWRLEVMVRSAFETTCLASDGQINLDVSSAEGRPRFSSTKFGVTIAQATFLWPTIPLHEMERIIIEEADRRGTQVLTAQPDCQAIRLQAPSERGPN